MTRSPSPLIFARVLSVMMHPGPLAVLGLMVLLMQMNSERER
jgi:hypothetical protein